jgi:large subunit ribosomal protein L17
LRHGEIETTVEKAKELRPIAERLITLAKEDTVHHRRRAYSYLYDKAVVQKLFNEVGPSFKSRPGGYLRIVRTRLRAGDNAEMAFISFVTDKVAQGVVAKEI